MLKLASSGSVLQAATALCIICSVQCMRPVVRLPRDAERTGRYIAVLTEDASLMEIVETLRNLEDCNVHSYVEVGIKAIVADLSYEALEKVKMRSIMHIYHKMS